MTLCLFVAGVLKVFQISTTLTEIKDLLQRNRTEIKAAPEPAVAPIASTAPSGEEMLRALDREMRIQPDEAPDQAGLDPEIVNPR
jgi:hypothetical protein